MDHATIERVSKALANDTRLLIFEATAGSKEMNCGVIASQCGVKPATVPHLRILLDAGLIERRRHGPYVHNRVLPETVANFASALSSRSRAKRQSLPHGNALRFRFLLRGISMNNERTLLSVDQFHVAFSGSPLLCDPHNPHLVSFGQVCIAWA